MTTNEFQIGDVVIKKLGAISLAIVAAVLLFGAGRLSAGNPDAPGGPTSAAGQMHTLDQIYQRLDNGGAFTSTMTTFTEPTTAPVSGTMVSLEDIYERIGTSAHVPKTAANLCPCGTPGDDSELRRGVAWPTPRFVNNGNGTVTDKLTGLIWLRNANCFNTQTWNQALTDATSLASPSCGLSDGSAAGEWRLPNVRELLSLIDYNNSAPAFPSSHPFLNLQASVRYWSSTSVSNASATAAWNIDFDIGTVNRNAPKTTPYFVWPVRGGQG